MGLILSGISIFGIDILLGGFDLDHFVIGDPRMTFNIGNCHDLLRLKPNKCPKKTDDSPTTKGCLNEWYDVSKYQ